MLYAVSFIHGLVGIFSSEEKIKELIFNKYKHIYFIIQAFKSTIKCPEVAWTVLYKNTDNIIYVSDSKNEAERIKNMFTMIGKTYDDNIDYWELKIDVIIETLVPILDSMERSYAINIGIPINSEKNIIHY